MKLLHVVPTYLPALRYGGVVRAAHGLCRALARRGHEVTVYTSNVDGPSRIAASPVDPVQVEGVAVRYFPARLQRLCFCPDMARELALRVAEFDLVHVHTVFLWPTWAAARAARRSGVPYLVTPHGMLVPDLVRRRNWLVKRLWIELVERHNLEAASAIHVTSQLEANDLLPFRFRLPEIIVVPNGTDEAGPSPDPMLLSPSVREALSRTPVVLFLGRLNWKKGLDRLIAALPKIPGAHLVIAGNDEEGCARRLGELARALGVADRMLFTGEVNGADKTALLAQADVFVLPSFSENFGIAVLEAMAHGCPVIVTKEVGLAAEIRASGSGLVVEPDPVSLGEAIASVLRDPQRRTQMGRRGRDAVTSRYSWGHVAESFEPLLAEIARKRGGNASRPTPTSAGTFSAV